MRIFVVGATGLLGGKVVDHLLHQGDEVTALVRDPSAAAPLAQRGVRLVVGDLKDRASLRAALARPFDGLITTAYGYGRRRKGDTLQSVDDIGNRNLIEAARNAGIGRFVFTSILTADKAIQVPHFHQKARTEAELERSGLDWVALRPGGFMDTLLGLNIAGIRKGRLIVPTDPDAPASSILSDDLAIYLTRATRIQGISGARIDIGMDRPTTLHGIAAELSLALGHPVSVSRPPALAMTLMKWMSALTGGPLVDNLKAMAYVATGQYVADTRLQTQLFGPAPTLRDSIQRWVKANDLGGRK